MIINRKYKLFAFVYIICLILRSPFSFSQNVVRYNTKSGLPDLTSFSLHQDKNGLLWIASQAGLVVFNGVEFESVGYGTDKGTRGIIVQKMVPLEDGSFYTYSIEIRGTAFYGHLQQYFPSENSSKDILKDILVKTTNRNLEYISDIIADNEKNLWVITSMGKLIEFNRKKEILDTIQYSVDTNLIGTTRNFYKFINVANGNIRFVNSNGIYEISIKKSVKVLFEVVEDGISGAFGFNDDIFICTVKGNLFNYSDNEAFVQHLDSNLNVFNPFVLSSANDGENIAFGSYYGVLEYNTKTKKKTIYTNDANNKNSIPSNGINCLTYDSNGNLWVGTGASGIACIKKNSFKFNYQEVKDEKGNVAVYDGLFLKDKWILATSRGLINYDYLNKKFKVIKEIKNENFTLEGEFLTSRLFQDLDGNIWYGRFNEVTVYDGKSLEQINSVTVHFGIIKDFLQLNRDEIWIAQLSAGIIKYNLKTGEQRLYSYDNGLPDVQNYVFNLKNYNNRIFTSTNTQGALEYNPDKDIFEKMDFKENTTSIDIEIIDGNMWMGSYLNKLFKVSLNGNDITSFDNNKSKAFSINQMEYDDNHGIWFSTLKGLGYFNLKDEKFRWFNNNEEIPFDELNPSYEIKKIDKDLMFLGQPEGFLIWSDSIIDKSIDKPKLYFVSIKFKGEKEELSKLKSVPVSVNNLDLNYDQNSFDVYFTGIELLHGKNLVYRYKLSGRDDEWIDLYNVNHIRFLDLKPGNYELQVVASVDGINWTEPIKLEIKIALPWWEEIWFRISAILVLFILIYLIYLWRTKSLRERQRQLEQIVSDRTYELKLEKEIVEEKQKEIIDSITYAQRLQRAILAPEKEIKKHLPESFLLYLPKDIVAGDFYFFEITNEFIFYAAADCTGHGVPGAMVSVVCSNALTRCVKEFGIVEPGEILNKTRDLILDTFQKSGEDVKDGMDISLLVIDKSNKRMQWAGANNALWYFENNELIEIKGNKQPIGKIDNPLPFKTHTLPLSLSTLFLFTDGYADQFGGEKGKKFKYANLQKLLIEISEDNMDKQRLKLENAFLNWKGELEQVDDVCIIGIKF